MHLGAAVFVRSARAFASLPSCRSGSARLACLNRRTPNSHVFKFLVVEHELHIPSSHQLQDGCAEVEMSRLDVMNAQPQEDEAESDVADVEEGEYDNSEVESDVESEVEKDETEEELERLVFGDSAGFRERLKGFPQEEAAGSEDEQDITGLEGLDDAEVGQALVRRAGVERID